MSSKASITVPRKPSICLSTTVILSALIISITTATFFPMTNSQPFQISVSDETLDTVRKKVAAYPWHEMPDDGGWDYGTNLDYMKEFADYWVNEFDWRKQEAAINRFSHFTTPVDGKDLHYILEKGSGPAPMPLLISHSR